VNVSLFTVGQVWIIAAESFYLWRITRLGAKDLLTWVVTMNLASTALGAFGIPFLWAVLTGIVSYLTWSSQFGKVVAALGTWALGDDTPYPKVAIAASIVGFCLTYLPTVWIELYLSKQFAARKGIEIPSLRKHLYLLNAVSYAGLVLLMIVGLFWDQL
jgi:hypothetical protein